MKDTVFTTMDMVVMEDTMMDMGTEAITMDGMVVKDVVVVVLDDSDEAVPMVAWDVAAVALVVEEMRMMLLLLMLVLLPSSYMLLLKEFLDLEQTVTKATMEQLSRMGYWLAQLLVTHLPWSLLLLVDEDEEVDFLAVVVAGDTGRKFTQ